MTHIIIAMMQRLQAYSIKKTPDLNRRALLIIQYEVVEARYIAEPFSNGDEGCGVGNWNGKPFAPP